MKLIFTLAIMTIVVSCTGGENADVEAGMTAIAQTETAEGGGEVAETETEENMPTNTPTTRPTNTPLPTATPQPPTNTPEPTQTPSPNQVWAINYAGGQDSGGVKIEIARIVIGYKDAIDQNFEELNDYLDGWEDIDVVGELIFKVTNNTEESVDVYPDQGTVQIGGEQINLDEYMMWATFGEDVGGEIYPGVTKIGGMWFGIKRSTPEEINEVIFRASAPSTTEDWTNLGPDYEIVIDTTEKRWEEVPDELK